MRTILSLLAAFTLTACSGGGGGGSSAPSSSVPEVIKYPKAKCGTKDCLTGATISTMANEGTAHDTVKNGYSNIKTRLSDIKTFVEFLNAAAAEEDIESCQDLPVAGSYTWDVHTFTFSAGGESWNIGSGLVAMTHKVLIDNPYNIIEVQFKCDTSTVQYLHVKSKSKVSTHMSESFSQIDSMTGVARIQVATITDTSRDMAYFYSDGGDKFTLASFFTTSGAQYSALAKAQETAPEVNPEQIYIETVHSSNAGVNLDNVAFGDSAGAYRGCVFNYRTSSPSYYPNSCDSNNQTTKYALISGLSPILLGDANAWETDELDNMTIIDPQ